MPARHRHPGAYLRAALAPLAVLLPLAGLALLAGCQERVVKAKGIGTDRYVVQPDQPSIFDTKRAQPVGPTPNPYGPRYDPNATK